MDTKSFAIGTLSVTAVILLAALVILGQLPDARPALGSGVAMAGGDYMILTGYYERNSELLYVIDTATKRLNAYAYDMSRGKGRGGLGILQSVDLTKLLPGPPAKRSP
ncbi:MAG: hypothetical protein JSU68_10435 [Phycisphaerales bacterium]|nr:MAG: hypothetical protein JSU68_10435 [Phycisphaerales bacterium]